LGALRTNSSRLARGDTATLHYYFATKESLIRAVVLHGLQRFVVALPHGGTPAEQLLAHLEAVREILKTDQQLMQVLSEVTQSAPRASTPLSASSSAGSASRSRPLPLTGRVGRRDHMARISLGRDCFWTVGES
jgi:AcrR family transcriptional regulator